MLAGQKKIFFNLRLFLGLQIMRKKIFAVGNSYYLAISLLLFYVEHFSACINAKQSDGNFHFFDSKKKRAYQRAHAISISDLKEHRMRRAHVC